MQYALQFMSINLCFVSGKETYIVLYLLSNSHCHRNTFIMLFFLLPWISVYVSGLSGLDFLTKINSSQGLRMNTVKQNEEGPYTKPSQRKYVYKRYRNNLKFTMQSLFNDKGSVCKYFFKFIPSLSVSHIFFLQ